MGGRLRFITNLNEIDDRISELVICRRFEIKLYGKQNELKLNVVNKNMIKNEFQ
jgi:hypothetical protein